ncbi:hypothetical protein [Streptomyces sp. NPDC057623]|uniref:hypothetical protein n=1 Tax=Streptomyces sp. NPDC057623 TaxID=3346187 RepID=UPI0036CCB0BF
MSLLLPASQANHPCGGGLVSRRMRFAARYSAMREGLSARPSPDYWKVMRFPRTGFPSVASTERTRLSETGAEDGVEAAMRP